MCEWHSQKIRLTSSQATKKILETGSRRLMVCSRTWVCFRTGCRWDTRYKIKSKSKKLKVIRVKAKVHWGSPGLDVWAKRQPVWRKHDGSSRDVWAKWQPVWRKHGGSSRDVWAKGTTAEGGYCCDRLPHLEWWTTTPPGGVNDGRLFCCFLLLVGKYWFFCDFCIVLFV